MTIGNLGSNENSGRGVGNRPGEGREDQRARRAGSRSGSGSLEDGGLRKRHDGGGEIRTRPVTGWDET